MTVCKRSCKISLAAVRCLCCNLAQTEAQLQESYCLISRGKQCTAVQKSLPLKHCAVAHYSSKCIGRIYVYACVFCLFVFAAKCNIRDVTKLFLKTVCSEHGLNLFLTNRTVLYVTIINKIHTLFPPFVSITLSSTCFKQKPVHHQ